MICFNQVNKSFGATKALDQFSLTVDKGLVYGLIGPNGAGKTTAMSILATLQSHDSGLITVDGLDVSKEPEAVRSKIGYMPDFFGVYDDLHAGEYLEFFAAAYHIPAEKRPHLAEKLLELVNLPDKADVYVDSLSRGMKQRLALARCLVHEPQVLILDEPASGLDPRARAEMKEIIRYLKQMDKTVLISSHILPELAEICDEVAIMDRGKLVACGAVAEITAVTDDSRQLRATVLERPSELAAYLPGCAGVSDIRVEDRTVQFVFTGTAAEQAVLLQRLIADAWPVVAFSEVERNLEEAFMSVTDEEVGKDGGN